jgi:hypothetical protein
MKCVVSLLALAWCLSAQSPARLSEFFEGKTVVVKMDMPATQEGVDIYPQRPRSLDLDSYSKNIKRYGTALRSGDSVMITKVKVKDRNIEFQLGGGGYGTFFDESSSSAYVAPSGKSNREKDLENRLKSETNPDTRKRLSRELDDVRRDREGTDRQNQALAAQAAEAKKQRIDTKRLQAGSRFNVRYESKISAEALTPEAVMAALTQAVEFSPENFGRSTSTSGVPAATAPEPAASLRKGMTKEQVESLLGSPRDESERVQDGMKTNSCTFHRQGETIRADFVNGVLVRYVVSSQ